GTKPLQLLLSKGASVYDITKQHDTPLHAAARAGRQHNVALLAKIISDDDKQLRVPEDEDEEGDENATAAQKKAKAKKTPASKVNQKNRGGLTALHLAVNFGHVECVKTLIQFGANVEETAGGAASKVTPLMIACQQGDLPLVKYLIEQAHAVVNSKDKLKRTPLTHAVISGQGHVTSYLLRLGADPNMADSSENTPAHYAAAYGWYFCLKLLGEAGASMNAANAWQLTPLAVAYLKGHMGLADFLLEGNWQDPVDINCKDNDGLTLVSTVASNGANEQTLGQLTYLITKKHADCSITDTMGNTPLHHLAAASVTFLNGTETTAQEKEYKISVKDYLAIAALLIQGGADPSKKNEMGNTALQLVIEQFNLPLAEFLFAKGGSLADVEMAQPSDVNQRTILHDLLTLPLNVYSLKDKWSGKYGPAQEQIKVVSLFNKLASLDPERVRVMLKQMDKNGLTPMLLACKQCSAFNTHQFAQDNYSVAERKLIIEGAEKALQAVIEVIEAVEAILPGAVVQQVGEDKSDIMGKKSDEDEEDMEDSDEEDEDEDKDDEDSLSEHDEGDDATEEKREKKKKEKSQSARATHAHADQGRCSFHFAVLSQTPSKESNGAAESAATYSPDSVKLVGGLLRAAKRSKKLADALIIRDAAGFTPLLTALHHHKMNAAISIIRASQEEGCGSAVQSACITEDGTEKEPPSKKTALMMAIENKMLGAIKEFRLSPAEMNAVDKDGNNALHYAARQLQMHTATVMEILVKGGAQFTLNKWKRSPLHIAINADDGAADGTTEPIEWLIENGGDKNNTNGRIYEKDIRGRLPLHYAFVKIARHTDVSKIDPISVVSVLIRAMDKKFLDTKDEFGCTPLHYAAMRGANICIVTLLQHGSDPNILTIHGNSSLGFATLHGHEPSALTLLQARSSIAPMITSGKLESVQDYDKKNKWIWTPNKPEMRKEVKAPIASIVVKNGWQGIIYIILDLLTKNLSTVTQLVSAAVEHRKYNLALSLL
uniref:Uncharacterized protein n=1 Tax=Plectus sambesii TaxID=2011161 RepID=A0A914XND2_9BILA